MDMPKILLTNHNIINYAGSELVTLDMATEFQQRGWNVTVATFRFGGDIEKNFNERGIKVVNVLHQSLSEWEIEFDVIWSHHFPVLIKCLVEDYVKTKFLVLSSLSPYEPLESIPFFHSKSDLILCNSEETKKEHLQSNKYTNLNKEKLFVFINSVPSGWFNISRDKDNSELKRIGIISNHPPAEVLDAINILKSKKIDVDLIGISGTSKLVNIDVLSSYDAIITIGRTVQHCMALGIPVFCYDHFGGPGWLSADNFQLAEWFNYSGRCSYQRFQSQQLVDNLLNGFIESRKHISFFRNYALENYSLTKNTDTVLARIDISKRENKDYLDFNSEQSIGKVGKVYRRIFSEGETLQQELQCTQSQLQYIKSELQLSQWQLQQTQTQLELSQSQLEDTCEELNELRKKLINFTLEAAFDTPNNWEVESSNIRFSGWCFHQIEKINKLILYCNDIVTECSYGSVREDVGEVYPNFTYSVNSAFDVTIFVPPGQWEITLEAHLESGRIVKFKPSVKLLVSHSYFWEKIPEKLENLFRFAKDVRKRLAERKQRLGRGVCLQDLPLLVKRALYLYKQQKVLDLDFTKPAGFQIPQSVDVYDAWLQVNKWNEISQKHLQRRLEKWETKLPKISVVMPVYNTNIEFLESAIESVVNQVYSNWELCIADDCSTNPEIHSTLKKWAAQDSRIKVIFREENGNISAASNSAASIASSEFIAFLDHDDELTLDALGEVALHLAEYPDTDFLYSDDDKIDTQGCRFSPQFKPDWSPELLLSYMYLSHLCVVRRSIFQQVGGLRLGYEGSQDYDFALRATEVAGKVKHLPLVLYHWRAVPGSTATSGSAKPASFIAGKKALQDALGRRGLSGSVYHPEWAAKAGCGIFEYDFPDEGASVTILIPTKNKLNLLQTCLNSLKKTTYKNYQVVVIDNESDDSKTLAYLEQIPHQVLQIGNNGAKFNYAAINNRAVEQIDTDYVLFLNNDTEVISPQWLSQMMGFAQFQKVGSVGARLLYPDRRIQHAGVVHGLNHGLAAPAFKTAPEWDFGYLSYAKVARNYSAVTAACLLTPRKLFLAEGGFDEEEFAVAYNDVDYCYRLVEKGYRCVYCPTAELIHHEGLSRGFVDNPKEPAAFKRKYADKVDPWYNPHLSLIDEHFRIQPRKLVIGSLEPVKILMFTHNLNWEGAPFSQYEMTVKLKETGVINPIVYSPEDGPLKEDYEQKGITVYVKKHPLEGAMTNDDFNRAISELAKFIEELGVELIYCNTLQTFYGIAAAEHLGMPSIWNIRESEPWQTYFNDFGQEIAVRALECFKFPYRIIFVADATRDRYLSLNSHHNFTVIHNGLNLERLKKIADKWTREKARQSLNVDEREIALLLLGTVCERKGQHDLALALAKIPEQLYSKIKVFIVGDRPSSYSDELKAIIANLPEKLRYRIKIVPETSDTALYYKSADIFIFTSRIESFPRVILEAMAYGLPIITTPVFGVKEQVQEGINAIFYQPGEIVELADAIVRLLKDKDMRERLAKNSYDVLNCLNNFEDVIQDYANLFREASFTNKK